MRKPEVLPGHIANRILLLRGQRVLLDKDLAMLYGVSTKRFNEQVRRNATRFPLDFMFQLSAKEWKSLRSQIATLKTGRGEHRKYLPLAFTEHGAIMAATILNSHRAVEVSVYVVRAFLRVREFLASRKELARRLDELEKKVGSHDQAIVGLLSAIRVLMAQPKPARRRPIGFVTADPSGDD
jgi:ORF6N domain